MKRKCKPKSSNKAIFGAILGASKQVSSMAQNAKSTNELGMEENNSSNEMLGAVSGVTAPWVNGMDAFKNKDKYGMNDVQVGYTFLNPLGGGILLNRKKGEYADEQMRLKTRSDAMNSMLSNTSNYDRNIPTFEEGGEINPQTSNKQVDDIEGQMHTQGGTNMGGLIEAQKGETKKDNYIYSDNIIVNKRMAKEYDMPNNFIGKSMAEVSKVLQKKYGVRNKDTFDNKVLDEELDILRDAQEEVRSNMTSSAMKTIQSLNPNMVSMIQGKMEESQQPPEMQTEQSVKYAFGGEIPPDEQYLGKILSRPKSVDNLDKIDLTNDLPVNYRTKANLNVVTNRYNLGSPVNPDMQFDGGTLGEVLIKGDTKKETETPLDIKKREESLGVQKATLTPTDLELLKKQGDNSIKKNVSNTKVTLPPPEGQSNTNPLKDSNFWMQNLGNAFDLVRGTIGLLKPEKKLDRMKPNLISPSLVDAQTSVQDINNAYGSAIDAVKQNSVSAGNYLSNRLALASQQAKDVSNTRKQYDDSNSGIMNQTRAANAQILGNAQQVNIGQSNLQEQINQQERDVSANMIQAGLSNMGEIYGGIKKDYANTNMDKYAVQFIGTPDYYYKDLGNGIGKLTRKDGTLSKIIDFNTMEEIK